MKTMLFCTSYGRTLEEWEVRYRKWLNFHEASGIKADQIVIIDDGSPHLPSWKDVQIVAPSDAHQIDHRNTIIHFSQHLGRSAIYEYPGWFRSFGFAAQMAKSLNFDKVIHVESDAFLLSSRIIDWVNSLKSGWHALWCPVFGYKESAIQVICGDQLENYYYCTIQDYDTHYRGVLLDNALPYTSVNQGFKGDRYGEYAQNIPEDADYACQVLGHWNPKLR